MSPRDIRDRDNWLKAMMLDRRLKERTRLVLGRLGLHLNLKTGRCDPAVRTLATEVALPGSRDVVERMVRRALAEAENVGWIRRTYRHGGDAKRKSQTNHYALAIPDATTGLQSPVGCDDDRTKCDERPDSTHTSDRTLCAETTGLWSPANSEEENSEENKKINIEGSLATALPTGALARPKQEGKEEEGESEREGKQGKSDSSSISITSSSSSLSPRSARPLSPFDQQSIRQRQEAEATLDRYRAAANGSGGLTAGSSQVEAAHV